MLHGMSLFARDFPLMDLWGVTEILLISKLFENETKSKVPSNFISLLKHDILICLNRWILVQEETVQEIIQ